MKAQPEKFKLRKKRVGRASVRDDQAGDGLYAFSLLKGLEKVRTEWSLITLAYNLKRVLNHGEFPEVDGGGSLKALLAALQLKNTNYPFA